ncbi:MAG: hypothetical protein K0R15_837 [Clostridiales bacterium]|jgi:parvulin-like peptidyl-prolyl isomerase|nr:hypothetical protein [Bacillales bacterium]MDF2820396.1 hypothetical protein [Clostridiales bacterium]
MKLIYKKVIVLMLSLSLVASITVGCKNNDDKKDKEKENLASTVAASINDTKIYKDEVLLWQAVFEDNAGVTEWTEDQKTQLLVSLKDRIKEIAILSEMAKNDGMVLTDEEKIDIDTQAQEFFDGVPEEIKTLGVTLETAKRAFYNDALVGKVFDKTVGDYVPTDEEINTALNNDQTYVESVTKDPEYFMQQVTVKHILIKTINEDGTPKTDEDKAAAKTKADDIFAKVQSGEDFVALVKEFSEDTGSVEANGEITFGRDEMVPQFEEAAYDMEVGETRLVETEYGYHIMRLEAIPEITTEDYQAYQDSLVKYKEEAWTAMLEYLQSEYFWGIFEKESEKYTVNYVDEVWDKLEIGTIFS